MRTRRRARTPKRWSRATRNGWWPLPSAPSERRDFLRAAEPVRSGDRAHHRRRFTGRDPRELRRSSTPLELLYDLTIGVAFGIAADELTHYAADGHVGAGVADFVFASFAVSWTWLNYPWFASAYDTDDWVSVWRPWRRWSGVVILALGQSQMFDSIDYRATLQFGVMVAGYVVMRLSLVSCGSRSRATIRSTDP
jgi:low temperature requirement protein LtrA